MNTRLFALCLIAAVSLGCADGGDQRQDESFDARVGSPDVPLSDSVEVVVYRDTITACSTCEIRVLPLGEFGSLRDPVLLRGIPVVEHDGRDGFYATVPRVRDHELIQYSPDGEFLRMIGRNGSGPGEFQSIWDIFLSVGDTLFVGHDNRVSAFDSSGAFVRDVRLEPVPGLFARAFAHVGDQQIILSEARSSASPVLPLQVYDDHGNHLRSLGPPSMLALYVLAQERASPSPHIHGQRVIGWNADGSAWLAGGIGGYRLERVDMHGRLSRVIGVNAPGGWNMPELFLTPEEAIASLPASRRGRAGGRMPSRPIQSRDGEIRPSAAPPGLVKGVLELDDSRGLVVLHVPSGRWRDARRSTRSGRHGAPDDPGYYQELYDTVLDVINLRDAEILARQRIEGAAELMSDGTLYLPAVDSIGVVHVRGLELEFVGFPTSVQ